MPRLNERNSFTNENGNDVDDELVNLLLIQKPCDELAASDKPDILSWGAPDLFAEFADVGRDELYFWRGPAPISGKDVVLLSRITALAVQAL